MAKKSTNSGEKALVIVESPAKARTIGKFLGKDYKVEASIGHVRDLPQGAKQVPEKYRGESWSHLGVNVDDEFDPIYIVPPGKTKQVTKLRKLLKECSALYLATDEDREGEAISWHLEQLLKPKVPVHRMVFHEITKEAINEALSNPRKIDDDLVRAQETRRIVDRLYGYEVSPLLWRKIRPKLSAGRVQSVSVRLIVERERERMAFVSATFWDALGTFAKIDGANLQATLVSVDGKRIPSGKDFDAATGLIKNESLLLLGEDEAMALVERLKSEKFRVASLDNKPYTSKPSPPFTTSTLQQEANRKLGFTAKRTMGVAQSLYENGHITYMRTDSTNLANAAIEAARDLVTKHYGSDFLPDQPRKYTSKVKNAQEAHEAIRPAGHPFEKPETLKAQLNSDEYKLFDMIWKRTIASQMSDAKGHRVSIGIEGGGALFQTGGKTIDFPGFLRAYVEGSDDPSADLADRETVLPTVAIEESLNCTELESKSHTTQPPARFTEASLTRELERMGIGRPSTYASIIDTILARNYVFKKGSALVPTWTAFAVSQLLTWHLPELVDYQFTAQMEDDLDAISRGEQGMVEYLNEFYHGNRGTGLKQLLEDKIEKIDAKATNSIAIGRQPELGAEENPDRVVVRVGRYGPYVEQGERRASLPEDMPPDEINIAVALELLEQASKADEPLGTCPDTQKPIFLKLGRFGPYIQRGTPEDEEKPKNASLLKGMQPEDIDLATALKLLSLPREVGADPKSGETITAFNGRYGPYIKSADETRSLPAEMSPLEITLEQSLELLAQPKKSRGFGAKKEPIKVFEESPVTKEKIQLLEGRYGPYVTDGETNASLPKGKDAAELKFEEAVDLLAIRAAKGPTKKKKKAAKKKKAPKKKTAKKKTAKKKSTTKKKAAPKKKSTTKKRGGSKKVAEAADDAPDAPF